MKENIYIHLLKHRSFMAFWGSTTLLRLASNILQFALAIYVLDLTGSAFSYSTVLSVIILPRILCSSFAGYLADYKDSIQLLRRGTLSLTALMACFFAIHSFALSLNLPLIYALVISLELCETFLGPAEGKALIFIVNQEEIAPASKLSSLDDGIVEILSPVIGALFYSSRGITGVLAITLFAEVAAFLLSLFIRQNRDTAASVDKQDFSALSLSGTYNAYREAILCLKNYPYIIGIIMFAPLFNFFVSPLFSVTAAHYFRITMQADVDMYAMFNTVLGISGLISPFLAMFFISDKDECKALKRGTAAGAVVLLCLSCFLYFAKNLLSPLIPLLTVTAAMALTTAIVTVMNIAASITVKKRIPEKILGRVISVIQLSAAISIPLGQLCFGLFADKLPVAASYLLSSMGLALTLIMIIRTYRSLRCMRKK